MIDPSMMKETLLQRACLAARELPLPRKRRKEALETLHKGSSNLLGFCSGGQGTKRSVHVHKEVPKLFQVRSFSSIGAEAIQT